MCQKLEAVFDAELAQRLHRRGVVGAGQGFLRRHHAVIRAAQIIQAVIERPQAVRPFAVISGKRLILDQRGIGDDAGFQRRRIDADGLIGGTGLLGQRRRKRIDAVGRLFAAPADERQDTAVIADDGDARFHSVVTAKVCLIQNVILRRILQVLVDRRIDLQAVCIDHRARGTCGAVIFLHQRILHVADDRVSVPIPNAVLRAALFADEGHVVAFFHGLVVVAFADEALIVHFRQHELLALAVIVRMDQGVIARGILRNARDGRAFGHIAIGNILAEVQVCGRLDADRIGAEGDAVEVRFEDFFL